jgi:hypothetical protein
MTVLLKTAFTTCTIAASLALTIAPVFALRESPNLGALVSSTSTLMAYSVEDDAYASCVDALAVDGITVTQVLETFSGKGGATLLLAGYNSGGYAITAECTLTIPSREISIEYK